MPYPMIGADPEFVILDQEMRAVPAHKFGFPDKHNRPKRDSYDPYHRYDHLIIRDGFMLEVNPDGATCREVLSSEMSSILYAIQARLPAGHTIRPASTVPIDLAVLADAPKDVKEFGCEPSLDAYNNGERKVVNLDGERHRYRYCGGHIHLSNRGGSSVVAVLGDPRRYPTLVQWLDLYLGVVDAVVFDSPDDFRRRKYYGQAGEYRAQKYPDGSMGVEYRVPSSKMWNRLGLMSLYFGVCRWVVKEASAGMLKPLDEIMQRRVRKAVNKGIGARDLLQTVPGFYTPEDIVMLRDKHHDLVQAFEFRNDLANRVDGWTNWAANLGLPGSAAGTIKHDAA